MHGDRHASRGDSTVKVVFHAMSGQRIVTLTVDEMGKAIMSAKLAI